MIRVSPVVQAGSLAHSWCQSAASSLFGNQFTLRYHSRVAPKKRGFETCCSCKGTGSGNESDTHPEEGRY
jgi:hypothetical protein